MPHLNDDFLEQIILIHHFACVRSNNLKDQPLMQTKPFLKNALLFLFCHYRLFIALVLIEEQILTKGRNKFNVSRQVAKIAKDIEIQISFFLASFASFAGKQVWLIADG